MSDKGRKEFMDLLQRAKDEFAHDKDAARRLLFEAGILNMEGKVTKRYGRLPLCIPGGPVDRAGNKVPRRAEGARS